MQCPSCQNQNPSENRFCGMCGTPLLAKRARLEPNPYFSDRVGAEPVLKQEFSGPDVGRDVAIAEVEDTYPPEPMSYPEPVREYRKSPPAAIPEMVGEYRPVAPVEVAPTIPLRQADVAPTIPLRQIEVAPTVPERRAEGTQVEVVEPERVTYRPEPVVIGGSSLLGLSGPSAPLRSDEVGDADTSYLMDERPRRTVSWRAWALLLILIGLGYLGYRQWSVNHYRTSPDISKVLSEGGQALKPDTPVHDNGSTPADAGSGAAAAPTGSGAAGSTDTGKPAGNDAAAKLSGTGGTAGQTDKAPAGPTGAADAAAKSATPAAGTATPKPAKPAPMPADAGQDDTTDNTVATPTKGSKAVAGGKAAAPAAVDYGKDPMYLRAQQYIHGRPQNCDMGLNYLRASADSNPKARIQMAALYESGVCVPVDRAQAYSWFSKAQEMDPHNMWLERSRSRLWSQMTEAERAKAH